MGTPSPQHRAGPSRDTRPSQGPRCHACTRKPQGEGARCLGVGVGAEKVGGAAKPACGLPPRDPARSQPDPTRPAVPRKPEGLAGVPEAGEGAEWSCHAGGSEPHAEPGAPWPRGPLTLNPPHAHPQPRPSRHTAAGTQRQDSERGINTMRQERDKKLRRAGQSVGPRPKCHRGGPCGRTGRQRAAKNTDTPRRGGRPSEPSTAHVRPPNLSSDGVTTRPSLSRGSPSSFRCFRHQRRHPASLP